MGLCISSKHDTLPDAQASAADVAVNDDAARCLEDPMIAFLTCARPVGSAQSSGSPVMYALKALACAEQPWSVVTGDALPYTREIAAALKAILSMVSPHKKALASAEIDTAHIQVALTTAISAVLCKFCCNALQSSRYDLYLTTNNHSMYATGTLGKLGDLDQ
jgi:hypothetical protein